jgi:hypothetical protein
VIYYRPEELVPILGAIILRIIVIEWSEPIQRAQM